MKIQLQYSTNIDLSYCVCYDKQKLKDNDIKHHMYHTIFMHSVWVS